MPLGYFTVSVSWMGGSWRGLPVEDMALGVTVIVEVPDGVTIGGGGGTTEALPPPQPATPQATQKTALARTVASLKRLEPPAFCKVRKVLEASRRSSASAKKGNRCRPGVGLRRNGAKGGEMAEPLVVTVTVKGAGAPPEIETLAGSWQAAPRGAPLHVSVTVPV
jgi:hypothetical protein